MQIVDSSYQGASGLEHQNSHVDVITPLALGNPFLDGLYAHEIFHAWNVKRLRPADLLPYRYDRPQPTPWLWVSEGITDYYADLVLVRARLVEPAEFLRDHHGQDPERRNATRRWRSRMRRSRPGSTRPTAPGTCTTTRARWPGSCSTS